MTLALYLLAGFIAVTLYAWHRYEVRRHQKAVRLIRQMQEWQERNRYDLDDWMPAEEGGEE